MVLVEDGNIVVLGGLIEDRTDNSRGQVPVLGDLPVVGNLFRYENRQRRKTNLLVFLRPYVVRDEVTSSALAMDRYDYIRGQVAASTVPDNFIFRDLQSRQLPEIPPTPPAIQRSQEAVPPATSVHRRPGSAAAAPAHRRQRRRPAWALASGRQHRSSMSRRSRPDTRRRSSTCRRQRHPRPGGRTAPSALPSIAVDPPAAPLHPPPAPVAEARLHRHPAPTIAPLPEPVPVTQRRRQSPRRLQPKRRPARCRLHPVAGLPYAAAPLAGSAVAPSAAVRQQRRVAPRALHRRSRCACSCCRWPPSRRSAADANCSVSCGRPVSTRTGKACERARPMSCACGSRSIPPRKASAETLTKLKQWASIHPRQSVAASVIAANRFVPYAFARDNAILLVPKSERDAEVWISNRDTARCIERSDARVPGQIRPIVVEPGKLTEAISQTYGDQGGSAQQIVGDIEGEFDITRMMQEVPDVEDLLETSDDAPIIRMINALLTQAARDGASDIHIEPFESYSLVRFRVDGTLRDIVRPKRALHAALVSRIKIMAALDIAEKRLPQDGRITLRVGGRPVDVRVSSLPTGHGERVVLRLLEKDLSKLELTNLGMADSTLKRFDTLIHQPHGIILVTGPTGSGKSTTLYAAIRRLDKNTTNIMTVEDPIEYDIEGIGQTQVNPKIEMTFARALRAILRQDPDVVMIGEIRDLETAQIAVQASLTGHLVLATIHTNDAASSVTRLIDMGIEPFLLSSSVLGVLGQRLVRKLCPHCKQPDSATHGFRASGCEQCGHTGYLGRTGIYELLRSTRKCAC
jgi:general secretion pathway protein E